MSRVEILSPVRLHRTNVNRNSCLISEQLSKFTYRCYQHFSTIKIG